MTEFRRLIVPFVGLVCAAFCACSAPETRIPPLEKLSPTSMTAHQLLSRIERIDSRPLPPGVFHWEYRTYDEDGNISLADHYEAWNGRSIDSRIVYRFDGVSSERGTKSGHAWQTDFNGLVAANVNRPDEFDRAWNAAARKSDPRVRVLGITSASPHSYVVEIRLNDETIERYYYDVKTLRQRELITADYNHLNTEFKLAYTQLDGIPLVVRSAVLDTLNGSSDDTLVRSERLPFDKRLISPPRSRLPFIAHAPLPAAVNSWFDSESPDTFVRAEIRGRHYWMQVRVASAAVAIDRTLATRLGLREIGLSYALLPRIAIGPLRAENLIVYVYPYYSVWGVKGIRGFVGSDFFAGAPLEIDRQHQTVRILKSSPTASDRGWVMVPTPMDEWQPLIALRLDEHPATLNFDFGAARTRLNGEFFDRFGGTFQRDERFTLPLDLLRKQSVLAATYIVPHAAAGGLDLGPIRTAVFFTPREQYLKVDGLLASEAVRNYNQIWDYQQQRMYFQRFK